MFLLGASLVTTLLIPPAAFDQSAANRALAYLAHGGALTTGPERLPYGCGSFLGILYDVVTVLILCLAGTSVMTVLAVLLPQFLLRFGMELRWTNRWGLLIILFGGINLLVTLYFQASVDDQRSVHDQRFGVADEAVPPWPPLWTVAIAVAMPLTLR